MFQYSFYFHIDKYSSYPYFSTQTVENLKLRGGKKEHFPLTFKVLIGLRNKLTCDRLKGENQIEFHTYWNPIYKRDSKTER